MVPVLAVSPLLSVRPLEASESDLRFKGSPWKVRRMAVGGCESRFTLLALLRLSVPCPPPPALDDAGPGLLLSGRRVRFCLTFRRRLSSRASSLVMSSSSSLAEDGGLRWPGRFEGGDAGPEVEAAG